MRYILVLLLTSVAGCSTIGEQVDKGLCLKWRTFNTEKMECIGGRGVTQRLCVVRQLQVTECAVWEWPEGRPEAENGPS